MEPVSSHLTWQLNNQLNHIQINMSIFRNTTYCCTVCITFDEVSFRFFKKLPAPPLMDENSPPPAGACWGGGLCCGAEGGRAGGGGLLGSGGRELGVSWLLDTGSLFAGKRKTQDIANYANNKNTV